MIADRAFASRAMRQRSTSPKPNDLIARFLSNPLTVDYRVLNMLDELLDFIERVQKIDPYKAIAGTVAVVAAYYILKATILPFLP